MCSDRTPILKIKNSVWKKLTRINNSVSIPFNLLIFIYPFFLEEKKKTLTLTPTESIIYVHGVLAINTVAAVVPDDVHRLRLREEAEEFEDNAVRPSEAFLDVVLAAAAALAGM